MTKVQHLPQPDLLGDALPTWLDAEAWTAFVEMRRAKGKRAPFTARAEKNMLSHLERMQRDGQDITAAIWQSVRNGWSDVYPDKNQPRKPGGPAVAAPAVTQHRREVGKAWLGRHGQRQAGDSTIDMEAPDGTGHLPR